MKGRDRQVKMTEWQYMDLLIDEVRYIHAVNVWDGGNIWLKPPGPNQPNFDEKYWDFFYELWFETEFRKRLGYAPTGDSVDYALDKYRQISQNSQRATQR